jgi:hypothetical protein
MDGALVVIKAEFVDPSFLLPRIPIRLPIPTTHAIAIIVLTASFMTVLSLDTETLNAGRSYQPRAERDCAILISSRPEDQSSLNASLSQ